MCPGDSVLIKKTNQYGKISHIEFNRVWVILKNGHEQKFMRWELKEI